MTKDEMTSSDGFKKPTPKSFRKPSGKKAGGQEGHPGKHFAVIADPDDIIDAVVTIHVTEHQVLEIPIFMLHGDTRKGSFPADIKATVQYGENLQVLAVALNTVGAGNMVKRCADTVSETVNKIKQKVTESVLGHFDENGTRVDKKLCEFTYLDICPSCIYRPS